MEGTTLPTATAITPYDKLVGIERTLTSELLERDREVHALLVALVARAHCFLLGSPGIAKSMVIERMVAMIANVRFENVLFGRLLPFEEVVGPISVQGMKEDHFRRKVEGYMPDAELFFADEIWKAASALLNMMLRATNERQFRNDGKMVDIPLSSMFCASNELPEGSELNAIYDRIALRLISKPVQDASNFARMLEIAADGGYGTPNVAITWDEVVLAQEQSAKIAFGPEIRVKMVELRRALNDKEIVPTPRRWVQCVPVLRAEAYLDGCDAVDVSHLVVLADVLWDRPEQFEDVEATVLELANPIQKKALDLMRAVEDLSGEVETLIVVKNNGSDQDTAAPSVEIQKKLKKARKTLETIKADSTSSRRQTETLERCSTRIKEVGTRMLIELFEFQETEVAAMVKSEAS